MPHLVWPLALALVGAPPPGLRFPDADAADPAPKAALSAKEADALKAKQHAIAGAYHWRQQRLAKALREFRAALALQPTLLPALKDAAKLAQELERNDEALDYAQRALKIDGTDAEMLVSAARLLLAKGREDEAVPLLEAANKLALLADKDVGLYVEIRELLAEAYTRRNNHAGAAVALRDLLDVVENPERFGLDDAGGRQLAGTRPGLALRLVAALRKAGDGKGALSAIADLGRRDPRLAALLREQRAEVELERGDAVAARKTLEEGLEKSAPVSVAALELLRRAYEKSGDLPGYAQKLDRLSKTYPQNEIVRQARAMRLFEEGKLDEAQALFAEGRKSPDGLAMLVRIAAKRQRPEQTFEALRKFVVAATGERRRDGGDDDANAGLEKVIAELSDDKALAAGLAKQLLTEPAPDPGDLAAERLYLTVAEIAFDAQAYAESAAAFKRCLTVGAGRSDACAERMLQAYHFADQPQELLDAAAKLPKPLAEEWYLLKFQAFAWAKLGKFAAGEKLLKDAAAARGGSDLLRALADLYRQELRYDDALATLKKVIDGGERKSSLQARYSAASIHSLRKRDDLAEVELLKVLEAEGVKDAQLQRLVAGAKNDLGYLWADAGKNLDRAERMIREALAADPENSSYIDSLGWALFKRGKFDEAAKLLKQAATMKGGGDATLWDHYGDALLKAGDRTGAAKAFAKAAELYRSPAHLAEKEKADPVQRKLDALGRSESDGAAPPPPADRKP